MVNEYGKIVLILTAKNIYGGIAKILLVNGTIQIWRITVAKLLGTMSRAKNGWNLSLIKSLKNDMKSNEAS